MVHMPASACSGCLATWSLAIGTGRSISQSALVSWSPWSWRSSSGWSTTSDGNKAFRLKRLPSA